MALKLAKGKIIYYNSTWNCHQTMIRIADKEFILVPQLNN